MAARKRRTTLNDKWRQRIQTSMIINRLQDHIEGKIELTAAQVRSAEILLKKTAPDLTHTTGEVTHTHHDELTDRMTQAKERAAELRRH